MRIPKNASYTFERVEQVTCEIFMKNRAGGGEIEGIPAEKGRGKEFGQSYTYESGWSEAI